MGEASVVRGEKLVAEEGWVPALLHLAAHSPGAQRGGGGFGHGGRYSWGQQPLRALLCAWRPWDRLLGQ